MSDEPQAHHEPDPPERATPSVWAYRGSIAALVLGSFLVLFLVLRPPESASQAEPVRPASTADATEEPTATPEPTPTATPEPVATPTQPPPQPTPVATPEPTPAPEPTPTPEPAAAIEYEIEAGDTLSDIAVTFDVTVEAILELNPGLDPAALQIGQTILVPRP